MLISSLTAFLFCLLTRLFSCIAWLLNQPKFAIQVCSSVTSTTMFFFFFSSRLWYFIHAHEHMTRAQTWSFLSSPQFIWNVNTILKKALCSCSTALVISACTYFSVPLLLKPSYLVLVHPLFFKEKMNWFLEMHNISGPYLLSAKMYLLNIKN